MLSFSSICVIWISKKLYSHLSIDYSNYHYHLCSSDHNVSIGGFFGFSQGYPIPSNFLGVLKRIFPIVLFYYIIKKIFLPLNRFEQFTSLRENVWPHIFMCVWNNYEPMLTSNLVCYFSVSLQDFLLTNLDILRESKSDKINK